MSTLSSTLPELVIRDRHIALPVIQGGMGIGVSLYPLAAAVAKEKGVGVISSAALDRLVSKRSGRKFDTYEAVREEVALAKQSGGYIGINIMVALGKTYRDTVRGAIDAGVDAIISGGGLPIELPSIHKPGDTALIPIVSSARSLELICKKWERQKYRPDAVILEGPLAGGHLGFKLENISLEEYSLENLLPPVLDVAHKYGDFPVIAAGGIYSHEDITRFLGLGARGVQMGTRFLATEESNATPEYKQAVLNCTQDDIVVAHRPGSPCGFPFRVIKQSPMYMSALKQLRPPKCDMGYVLTKDAEGRYTVCPAKDNNRDYFCICNGLLSSGGYNPDTEEQLFTVGTNAFRVNRIVPVRELMKELAGNS